MKWKHFLSIGCCLVAAACGPSGFRPIDSAAPAKELDLPKLEPIEAEPYFPVTPLWESQVPGSEQWTGAVLNALLANAPRLLDGADDIHAFCPSYSGLGIENRARVLAFLLSAMVRFESGFNPTTRYHEASMGTDAVTGLPVYSEGLLQLSYQDTLWAPFCEFDWDKDRHLSVTDKRKSIFDPMKNLNCGIRILNRQIEKRGRLVLSSDAYWAVLKSDAPHNKIELIQALTKALPACQYQKNRL